MRKILVFVTIVMKFYVNLLVHNNMTVYSHKRNSLYIIQT